MSETSKTAEADRWLVHSWLPILTGPDKIISRNAADMSREDFLTELARLNPQTALALTFEGSSLAKRPEFAKAFADPELHVERHIAFPGTGGGFVLLPLESAAAFGSGTRLLPSGRARWRAAKRILKLSGRFGMAKRLRRPELWTMHRRPIPQDADQALRGGAAIQSGVPGPTRCVIAQIMAPNGEPVGYTKIACEPRGGRRLVHEAEILHEVLGLDLQHARIPQLFGSDEHGRWIAMSAVRGERSGDALLPPHERFLSELHEATRRETVLPKLESFLAAERRMGLLEREARDERLTRLSALRDLVRERYAELEVDASLAHGDFTPWNLLTQHAQPLGVIDWEEARQEAAPFHDVLHFHLRVGVLVKRTKADELHKQLLQHSERRTGARRRVSTPAPWLALYLLDASSAHMEECRIARPDFPQVAWLEAAHDELVSLEIERLQNMARGKGAKDPSGRSDAA
ncbi:MAG: hypothetical protein AAF368_08580 [Planctomycetota bacterium]